MPTAKFVYTNMDKLIDFCAEHMASEQWPAGQVRAYLAGLLPTLKHGRRRNKKIPVKKRAVRLAFSYLLREVLAGLERGLGRLAEPAARIVENASRGRGNPTISRRRSTSARSRGAGSGCPPRTACRPCGGRRRIFLPCQATIPPCPRAMSAAAVCAGTNSRRPMPRTA